jgi:hypothetical protein
VSVSFTHLIAQRIKRICLIRIFIRHQNHMLNCGKARYVCASLKRFPKAGNSRYTTQIAHVSYVKTAQPMVIDQGL